MQKYLSKSTIVLIVYGVVVFGGLTLLTQSKAISRVESANGITFTNPVYMSVGYGVLALLSAVVVPWLIRNDPDIPGIPAIGRYLLLVMIGLCGIAIVTVCTSLRVGKQDFQYFNPIDAAFGDRHQYNYAQIQTISVVHREKKSEVIVHLKGQQNTQEIRVDAIVTAGLTELKTHAEAQGVVVTGF